MKVLVETEIEVNPKDESRCSYKCMHIRKISGTYHCTLTLSKHEPVEVDTGDDDDIGYGFKRTDDCLKFKVKDKE